MPSPAFPTWLYWRDGSTTCVWNQHEYDALRPGHTNTPAGPWPDGRQGDPMGVDWVGPFCPANHVQQPGGGLRVYATRPLLYRTAYRDHRLCARSPGEVFFLTGQMEDERLRIAAEVVEVPAYARPVKHPDTEREFLDQDSMEQYADAYTRGDSSLFDRFRGEPGHHTPPSVAPDQAQDAPRTQRKSRQLLYEREAFAQEVQRVYFDYCDERGERPTQAYVARNLSKPISIRTLRFYHSKKCFNLPYPPQH